MLCCRRRQRRRIVWLQLRDNSAHCGRFHCSHSPLTLWRRSGGRNWCLSSVIHFALGPLAGSTYTPPCSRFSCRRPRSVCERVCASFCSSSSIQIVIAITFAKVLRLVGDIACATLVLADFKSKVPPNSGSCKQCACTMSVSPCVLTHKRSHSQPMNPSRAQCCRVLHSTVDTSILLPWHLIIENRTTNCTNNVSQKYYRCCR